MWANVIYDCIIMIVLLDLLDDAVFFEIQFEYMVICMCLAELFSMKFTQHSSRGKIFIVFIVIIHNHFDMVCNVDGPSNKFDFVNGLSYGKKTHR